MEPLLDRFIAHLRVEKNASPYTVRNYSYDISEFLEFLAAQGKSPLETIERQTVRQYMARLAEQGIVKRSIARKLSAIRSFYRYLLREKIISSSPLAVRRNRASALKLEKRLPSFLNTEEMKRLLEAPDVTTPLGLRDKAILELLYASGLRVSELVGLDMDKVDIGDREVWVWGKGSKERVALMGKPAARALRQYLQDGRPKLLQNSRNQALFVNYDGGRLSERSVQELVKGYAKQVGIEKDVHPHMLRHTFATHLLDGGADLRVVQELMGHARLSSTQIYTHVAQSRARKVYDSAHPRAKQHEEEL